MIFSQPLSPLVPLAAFFATWLASRGQRIELAGFVLLHIACALGWLCVVFGVRGLASEGTGRMTKAAGVAAVLLGIFLNGILSLFVLLGWALRGFPW